MDAKELKPCPMLGDDACLYGPYGMNEETVCKFCGHAKGTPRVAALPSDAAQVSWRCFHCDEVFSDREAAAQHFGTSLMHEPACHIDIAKYREMEETVRRYNEEDTDLHREIHGISARHQTALRREEETGYARGLRDQKAEALQWVVERWNAEVLNRPLVNVHRRTLDETWRQVVRYCGGDDVALLGPKHGDLIAAAPVAPQAAGDAAQAPIYQVWVDYCFIDVLKDAYDSAPSKTRRIVYAAPVAPKES